MVWGKLIPSVTTTYSDITPGVSQTYTNITTGASQTYTNITTGASQQRIQTWQLKPRRHGQKKRGRHGINIYR